MMILTLLKQNKLCLKIARYIRDVIIHNIQFSIKKIRRVMGRRSVYDSLHSYKDIHKGERCFIIATGPSLTIEDVRKLKNEYTFGMNSICLLFDELGWETTYYGIQDIHVYEKLKNELSRMRTTKCFLGDRIPNQSGLNCDTVRFPLNYLNHRFSYDHLTAKFSDNAYIEVFDGYTITYSLMQIAVYMGFKEIYLLGNDCSYSKDVTKQHFREYGHSDPSAPLATRRLFFSYLEAKKYTDSHECKIYNATRGGMLEIFPRVDFDDVLKK